jgi:eukaryotic-like serine/threonine-protein kinase
MPSSCPQCGATVGPADRFCGDCGAALAASAQAGEAAPPELLDPSAAAPHADAPASERGAAESRAVEPGTSRAAESSAPPAAAHARDEGGAGAAAAVAVAPAARPSQAESQPESQPESDSETAATTGEVAAGTGEVAAGTGEVGTGEIERDADAAGARAGDSRAAGGEGDAVAPDESAASARGTGAAVGEAGADADTDTAGRAATGERAAGAGESERWTAENDFDGRATGESERMRPSTVRSGSTGRLRNVPRALDGGTLLHSRYEIVRRVGGGGMGAVYLARDKNLGDAPRAVKEMVQQNIDESQHEKAVGDFKRESMLLASLEHPSIPTIYDYFYDEDVGRFYLVMKYISGGDFLARLRNAPNARLDEKTVCDWGCQVADVLYYLHRQNPPIIYRDLKPANLMIDGNSGRVMLIDFGIARWVQKEEKGVTAVGTMGYAPPELFSGKVEPRSDIYSLGATMFHLLTGSDPQDNPLLIFDFNKNPRPRQIAPSLSNEMEQILMRAVEYKPENRFRSAAEMRDTLADHLEKLRTGQVTYGTTPAGGQSAALKTMQVEMVYCGFCGGRIAADDVYCAHCGQRQPMAVASAALRQARATAKLVVMGTTELDSSFLLQKESSLVGRSDPHSNIFPEVDLSRFDPQTKISRRHARIFRKGDVYLIEDLGSVNGTIVNDNVRLAPHQPRALESGDRLRLGETTLHFLIG